MPPRLLPSPAHVRIVVLAASLLVSGPASGSAQLPETVGGALLGVAGGGVVTLGVLAVAARGGHYVHGPGELSWEALPTALGAVAGGTMGHRNPDRLWRTVGWGSAGLVLGGAAGAVVGRTLLDGDAEGTWTGVLAGAAGGVLMGSVLGALTWDEEMPGPEVALGIRLSLGALPR